MVDVRKLNMILNNHAEKLNEDSKRIRNLERSKDDLYELIGVLDRRVDYCEAYTQAVDYLMRKVDEYKAPKRSHARRIVVKYGNQRVEVTRNG